MSETEGLLAQQAEASGGTGASGQFILVDSTTEVPVGGAESALGNEPLDDDVRAAVTAFRQDWLPWLEDRCAQQKERLSDMVANVMSWNATIRLMWFVGRVAFLADFSSDGFVARSLATKGEIHGGQAFSWCPFVGLLSREEGK